MRRIKISTAVFENGERITVSVLNKGNYQAHGYVMFRGTDRAADVLRKLDMVKQIAVEAAELEAAELRY